MNKTHLYYKSYFLLFTVSLLFLFIPNSISLWRFNGVIVYLLLALSLSLSIFHLLLCYKLYCNKTKMYILLLLILVLVNLFFTNFYERWMLWLTFVLVLGAKAIDFRSIVRFHLLIEFCLCLSNIVSYGLGFVDNSLLYLGDDRLNMLEGEYVSRLSLGYPAATDFATHLLYMLIDFWILKRGLFKIPDFFICFFLVFFVVVYCDARQAAGCMLLIVILSFIIKNHKQLRRIGKIRGLLLSLSIPIFFMISLLVTLLYDGNDISWAAANMILSGRLHWQSEAIQEYGVHLLGQKILFVGAGFDNAIDTYNYVDNGYIQLLLLWGGGVMAIMLILFVKIGMDSYRRNDIVLLLSLFVAGVSTMITQFLFYPSYCILLLALTSSHKNNVPYAILVKHKRKLL